MTATLLFNPVTPHLSEALHQRVYRKLNPALPETVNLEGWPEPDDSLRDSKVEEQFDTLFKVVSLVYAARQQAKLKRRWPLSKLIVVAPRKLSEALRSVEALFVEMANVKTAEYLTEAPSDLKSEEWVLAVEADTQVFLSKQRDDTLLGEGIMRDLARRVQALRKELGYNPTDVLDSVHIAEIEAESTTLLKPYLVEMAELVRAKKVYLHSGRGEVEADWHESELDGKRIH